MKIFIADDHSLIMRGLEALSEAYGFTIVGKAKNGEEVIEWLEDHTCDVLILDIRMPKMDGIDVLRALAEKENAPNILMLSEYKDVAIVQQTILLGAKGYVIKGEISECLGEAVRKVSVGKNYFSEEIKDQVIVRQLETNKKVTLNDFLSKQEGEALEYLTQDINTDSICKSMNITKSSFYTITERMRLKLGVKKNIGLILLALKHGFKKDK